MDVVPKAKSGFWLDGSGIGNLLAIKSADKNNDIVFKVLFLQNKVKTIQWGKVHGTPLHFIHFHWKSASGLQLRLNCTQIALKWLWNDTKWVLAAYSDPKIRYIHILKHKLQRHKKQTNLRSDKFPEYQKAGKPKNCMKVQDGSCRPQRSQGPTVPGSWIIG